MNIEGAVAFITGASGGLGKRIAAKLAENGADIAVGYRGSHERAEETVATVTSLGRRAVPIQLDQAEPASVEQAVTMVVEKMGGLDILINNAAVASGGIVIESGDLDALTPEIWDELMRINLRGPYLLARAAASHLRKSDWGRIVNLGSTIGYGSWGADYFFAPSKAAVVPLTRFLAASLAPDVTVNCVAPGLMENTVMSTGASEEYVDGWREKSVLNKTTSIEDTAENILTFCKSETVTGQTVIVDGGIHFQ
jgi:3-oxoacyl-[acyl-carrier protein] reductase